MKLTTNTANRGEIRLTLTVDAREAAGDLQVSGFVTERTAVEIGFVLAEALRQHFDGAQVTATIARAHPETS